jgi:hypothetical protein
MSENFPLFVIVNLSQELSRNTDYLFLYICSKLYYTFYQVNVFNIRLQESTEMGTQW